MLSDQSLIELEHYKASIEYIDATLSDTEHALLCLEINNTLIIGYVLPGDEDVIYLPVELVEYATEENTSAYMLSPYKGIADYTSEILLNALPNVMFSPRRDIISRYYAYWDAIKLKYNTQIEELELGTSDFVEQSSKAS